MKIGLVLEGGGLRGAYTAGALAWFLNEGINFDYAAGISSGAQHLVNFMVGDSEYLKQVAVVTGAEELRVGLKPLLKEGQLVGYNRLFDEALVNIAPIDFNRLRANNNLGEIGIFDLEAGKTRWIKTQELDDKYRMLKAASLIPLAGKPVVIDDIKYIDAGVEHMIPINRSIEVGMDKHLVITTKPQTYERSKTGFATKLFMKLFYGKYTKFREMVRDRREIYYQQKNLVKELEKEGKALELFPSKSFDIGRFGGDTTQLLGLFELGYSDCEAKREEIYKFLELESK